MADKLKIQSALWFVEIVVDSRNGSHADYHIESMIKFWVTYSRKLEQRLLFRKIKLKGVLENEFIKDLTTNKF